jgi:hypothetical protein
MDLREAEWGGMDWIDLVQDRDQWRVLMNTVINLRVSQNVGKFFSSATGGFSKKGSAPWSYLLSLLWHKRQGCYRSDK